MLVGETDSFLFKNKSLPPSWTKDSTASGNHWPAGDKYSDFLFFTLTHLRHNALLFAMTYYKHVGFFLMWLKSDITSWADHFTVIKAFLLHHTTDMHTSDIHLPHMLPQRQTCFYFWIAQSSERRQECVMDVYSMPRTYPKDINSFLWGRAGIEEVMQTAQRHGVWWWEVTGREWWG